MTYSSIPVLLFSWLIPSQLQLLFRSTLIQSSQLTLQLTYTLSNLATLQIDFGLKSRSPPTLQTIPHSRSRPTLQTILPFRSRPTLQINFGLESTSQTSLQIHWHCPSIHPSIPPFTLTLNQSSPTLQLTCTFKSPATLQTIPPFRSRPTLQIDFMLESTSQTTLQMIPHSRSHPTLQVDFILESTSQTTLQMIYIMSYSSADLEFEESTYSSGDSTFLLSSYSSAQLSTWNKSTYSSVDFVHSQVQLLFRWFRSRPTLQINFTLENQQVKLLFKSAHTIHPSVPPFTLTLNQSPPTLQTIPPFRSRPTLQINFGLWINWPIPVQNSGYSSDDSTLPLPSYSSGRLHAWIDKSNYSSNPPTPSILLTLNQSQPTLQIDFGLKSRSPTTLQLTCTFKILATLQINLEFEQSQPTLQVIPLSYSSAQLSTWNKSTYSSDDVHHVLLFR